MCLDRIYWRPWLFEFHDQTWFSPELRQHIQNLLAFLWTHRILPFQTKAPYVRATAVLERVIEEIEEEDRMYHEDKPLRIVDCCSGAGGPMPAVERTLNARRQARSLPPVPVLLSDLHPHTTAWARHASASPSGSLSFVADPVDALRAPQAIRAKRHLRTFCLSFHHFGESGARAILQDAMESAEGICIFELQALDFATFCMMLCLFPLTYLVTPFVQPSALVLLLTYGLPVLPAIFVFDGLVSAYRTRTPDHLSHLATLATMSASVASADRNGVGMIDWKWEFGKEMHTWPFGRMRWAVGRKDRIARDEDDDDDDDVDDFVREAEAEGSGAGMER
ncbi:hypothetical protein JCM24511_00337 [Saitozyma sp. JCM 24511]|nr:hypothetical protein JCM24511_00337 [Saitozyma sp. JCM 24511]